MENQTKIILGGAGALLLLAVFLGLNYSDSAAGNNLAAADSGNVVATDGIHWHPKLEIIIDGEQLELPVGIGLTNGHDPMHTHETDGTVHLEYPDLVFEGGTTLGRFFKLWDKDLSPTSVLDYSETNGDGIDFSANGQEILDPENYQFVDGKTIKIEVTTNQS